MKEPNVSDMTIVETVDVKKAGGGIVVVPATDEIHRLKRRLTALEKTTELHDKELTESALSCDRRMKKLEKPTPLSCCEGCANKECGIRGRYGGDRRPCCYQLQFGLHSCCVGCINWPCPECQVPESIDDFRRRVAEMKCYRAKSPPAPDPAVVCLGCAKDDTCNHTRSKLCNLGGSGHPTCYRLEHPTCGECRNAYWAGEEYNGLCGKGTTCGGWIRRTSPRCTKDFEAIR